MRNCDKTRDQLLEEIAGLRQRAAVLEAAEQSRRQSEQRYRMLTESTTDMIFILNRSGDILYANRSAAAGIRYDADSLVGLKQTELFSPEKVKRHRDSVARVFETGEVHEADGMYRFGPDEIWLNTRLMPLRGEDGTITAVMGVARDITARKRAEAALEKARDELEKRVEARTAELAGANESLRQSEQKYKSLVEASPDAVILADIKGNVLFASHHTWEFLGFPDDEDLVGKSVFDFVVESDRPRLAANVPKLMQTRIRRNTEYTAQRKDGTTFPVEISSAAGPNTEQQPWAILAVVRDISERKQYEETLRQSEEKYRGLVDICPDSIVASDLSGKTLFVSKQTWKLLGVSEQEELVGQNTYDYVIEADRARLAANYADLLKVGRRSQTEYTALRKDGTTVPVELSSVISRDAQGCPTGAIAIIRDVSESKRANQALRQHYGELRAIHDGMAEGLVILDVETNDCIRANRSICELLGYSEEELKSLPAEKLQVPAMIPVWRERHRAMIEGLLTHAEDVPLVRKDGNVVYVDIVSDRITYNGRPCLIHLLRDTTERRQAQEALKKEHRTLKHLLSSSDHERQLIAYEIHDGLAQQLAGALMQIETYWHQKEARPHEAAKAYEAAVTMLRQAHFEARRLISGVRPPILDESGIVAAVAHLVNEQGLQNDLKIEFHSHVSFHRLVPILENAVYRIVQEALANACRHSRSDRVRVELTQRDDALRIKVQDWGVGFDPAAVRDDHFGLEGIRERARLLGGAITIESAPRRGTSVAIELPLMLRED